MAQTEASARDRAFLTACLDLARLGEGQTSPNPMVGAVLVKDGRIVGEGYHRRAGEPHAEVIALAAAGEAARGATLYVNLEPCVHQGRTPPCVDAILGAGVAEVVACMIDPDPRVNGAGFHRLTGAGVVVRHGLLRDAAIRLNEKFLTFVTRRRPFVTLKAAMTLDGRIAAGSGESRWISSAASREEAHRMRYAHDALLVGVNTILADDPSLTARWGTGKPLVRVVLDSGLRTPPTARLLENADGGRTLIFTLPGAPAPARSALERRGGVEVIEAEGRPGSLAWPGVLEHLARRPVMSLMVEGGGRVLGSALAAGVVDRLAFFVAPRIVGDRGLPAVAGWGVERLADALPVRDWSWRRIGTDWLVEGRIGPRTMEEATCSPD